MTAPLLIFGYGNPARGDDALGPEFVRRIEERFAAELARGELEVLTDYQLQVEHVLDLRARERVFFVDAIAGGERVEVRAVVPERDVSFTTHLLSPAALLHTYEQIEHHSAPSAWLITIPGEDFELGAPMSELAARHLETALVNFKPLTPSGEGPLRPTTC